MEKIDYDHSWARLIDQMIFARQEDIAAMGEIIHRVVMQQQRIIETYAQRHEEHPDRGYDIIIRKYLSDISLLEAAFAKLEKLYNFNSDSEILNTND
jgi:hypothetical protein